MVTENCGAISISRGSRPSSAARSFKSLMRAASSGQGRQPGNQPVPMRAARSTFSIVSADPEGERFLLRLREHLDVAAAVVLTVVGDTRFREQTLHQCEALAEHVAAAPRFF